MVAGGGLMSSVISTIPPNLPLIREACGKACLALLRNMNGSFKVGDKSVRNFDMVSYHRGNSKGFPLFFVAGEDYVLSHIYNPHRLSLSKEGLGVECKYCWSQRLPTAARFPETNSVKNY